MQVPPGLCQASLTNAYAQTVFLIDLPRLEPDVKAGEPSTSFKEDLVYFLKASKLRDDAVKALDEFDFSKTARYAFVHTV